MYRYLTKTLISFILLFGIASATGATISLYSSVRANAQRGDLLLSKRHRLPMSENRIKTISSKGMVNLCAFPNRLLYLEDFGTKHSRKTVLLNMENGFRIISSISQEWDNNTWVNVWKATFTYDNGNLTEVVWEQWDNDSWVNYDKGTYTYDANGKLTEELWEWWDNDSWANYEKATYTYDTNGNLIEVLWEEWDTDSWVNSDKGTFTYDGNGNLTDELWEVWDTDSWVNSEKGTYTYDGNGNLTGELWEVWDTDSWVNSEKGTYDYDTNGNLTDELWEEWDTDSWVNYDKGTYTYDGNGNLTGELWEWWDTDSWVNSEKGTYDYDTNGNLTEELWEWWDTDSWVNNWKYTDTYEEHVGIEEEAVTGDPNPAKFILSNYPNPFKSQTTIQFELPQASTVSLNIYNLNGELIKSLSKKQKWPAGHHLLIWDGTDNDEQSVASGIYFYRIQSETYTQTRKCMLLK